MLASVLSSTNGMMETSNFSSIKSAVTFIDTLDQYQSDEDVVCRFRFNSYTPQEGDRIAIFKFGWMYVKDYLVFEWAKESEEAIHTVVFSKHTLPNNTNDLYQFCYVSGENELQGASQTFSFVPQRPSARQPQDELSRLKEENAVLRKAFKCLTFQGENSSKEIAELRECFEELNRKFREQQEEMKSLKQRFSALEWSVQRGERVQREAQQHARRQQPIGEVEFDIMGLQSLPPFPFPK